MTPWRFYARLLLLGSGFMGIQLLWAVYNAYVPIFLQVGRPDFTRSSGVPNGFGLSAVWTGAVLTLDNWTGLVMLPWVGAFSDRIWTRVGRRKPFILVGAPIGALAFLTVPYSVDQPLWVFMIAIGLTFLAMNLFRSPTVALMPDITPSPLRSVGNGIINVMGGVGTLIGLSLGGAVFSYAFSAPFWLGAVGMLFGVALVLVFIREPRPEGVSSNASEVADELPKPGLVGELIVLAKAPEKSAFFILLSIFLWFLGHTAVDSFFTSFATNEFNVTAGEASATVGWFAKGQLAFALVGGWLGQRYGRRRVILTSLLLLAGAYVSVMFLQNLGQARALLAFAGSAWIVVVVNSLPMVVDCAPEGRLGTYTGLYYVASQSASMLGPIAAGWAVGVAGNRYGVIFPYAAFALVCAAVTMWRVRRGEPEPAA